MPRNVTRANFWEIDLNAEKRRARASSVTSETRGSESRSAIRPLAPFAISRGPASVVAILFLSRREVRSGGTFGGAQGMIGTIRGTCVTARRWKKVTRRNGARQRTGARRREAPGWSREKCAKVGGGGGGGRIARVDNRGFRDAAQPRVFARWKKDAAIRRYVRSIETGIGEETEGE